MRGFYALCCSAFVGYIMLRMFRFHEISSKADRVCEERRLHGLN